MRQTLSSLLCFLLAACASHPLPLTTVFDSHPHYPITVIPISSSLTLRHVAGPPCDYNSTARPHVGSEGTRTYSFYELLGAEGKKLITAPSMLSDPERELAEFRKYYRTNDQLTVFTSSTRKTILIVEDRSPAYPNEAHILLHWTPQSGWTSSQISVSIFPTFPKAQFIEPPDRYFASVVGISDTEVQFTAEGKKWSQRFEQ